LNDDLKLVESQSLYISKLELTIRALFNTRTPTQCVLTDGIQIAVKEADANSLNAKQTNRFRIFKLTSTPSG